MPGRMRLRTALAQMRGDHRPEVVHPAAHGLVRDRDPALRKQILDVTKAEREPEIEPNRLMYDLWREPISGLADFPHTLGYSAYVLQHATAGVTKPRRPIPLVRARRLSPQIGPDGSAEASSLIRSTST